MISNMPSQAENSRYDNEIRISMPKIGALSPSRDGVIGESLTINQSAYLNLPVGMAKVPKIKNFKSMK